MCQGRILVQVPGRKGATGCLSQGRQDVNTRDEDGSVDDVRILQVCNSTTKAWYHVLSDQILGT